MREVDAKQSSQDRRRSALGPGNWRSAWIALALAAACAGGRPAPTTPPPESAANASLRDFDNHPSTTVTIRFGAEHAGHGQVTLAVRGDGNVSVEQRAAGAVTRYRAQLNSDRLVGLGRALAEHQFTAPRTSTLPRKPGDTPLVLRISGPVVAGFETSIWYADRFADQDLDAILRAADDVLFTASAGKLGQRARSP